MRVLFQRKVAKAQRCEGTLREEFKLSEKCKVQNTKCKLTWDCEASFCTS